MVVSWSAKTPTSTWWQSKHRAWGEVGERSRPLQAASEASKQAAAFGQRHARSRSCCKAESVDLVREEESASSSTNLSLSLALLFSFGPSLEETVVR